MERWLGKIAVVTGASSGIGAAISIDLARTGLIVIGLARRVERVNELTNYLTGAPGKVVGRECDITDQVAVAKTFDWIDSKFGGVNILVNNAGTARNIMILEHDNEPQLNQIVDTNFKSLLYSTKAAFKHLQKYDAYGHIINVNSIAGHSVVKSGRKPTQNVYAGTKYAMTATTEVLRQELNYLQNYKVRVSSISPGMVDTEIFKVAGVQDYKVNKLPMLKPTDISQAILYMLAAPEHVQIHELIIKPVGEAF